MQLHYFKVFYLQVAQYIGEMCRYVLAVPPKDTDKQHKLRMIYGNGLRPQIWKEFVDRFKIPKVAEFYGATEGNANIGECQNHHLKIIIRDSFKEFLLELN